MLIFVDAYSADEATELPFIADGTEPHLVNTDHIISAWICDEITYLNLIGDKYLWVKDSLTDLEIRSRLH